jgi:hypothetical protein
MYFFHMEKNINWTTDQTVEMQFSLRVNMTLHKFSTPSDYLSSGVKNDKNLKLKFPVFWLWHSIL